MIYGIGIDMIEMDRIKSILEEKEKVFLQRLFTDKERALYPKQMQRKIEYAAGRFAAKEAVAKAFGTGIGHSISWKDIEITSLSSGKPHVEIINKGEKYTHFTIHLSITHTKTMAAAKVIIEQI